MSAEALNIDADEFWTKGYTIVRGAFSPEEIAGFRKLAYDHRDHKGDLLSHPGLGRVVLHDAVAKAATTILGSTPVYFGDGCVNVGRAGSGYHKDNADRHDARAPDWRSPYTLLRVGIYLQDHTQYSGGLNVRSGSHMSPSLWHGRTVAVGNEVGDMIVWSLRTTHSGNAVLLKWPEQLHVGPWVGRVLPRFLTKGIGQERVAMFMTLGLDDDHLKRYVDYLKTRTYMVDVWNNSHWSDEIRAAFDSSPIMLRDIWSEVQNDPGVGSNPNYAPIPY